MTAARARTLASVASVAVFLAALAAFVLIVGRRDPVVPNRFGMGPTAMLAFLAFGLTWTAVGVLLARRRPDNATGYVVLLGGGSHVISILTCAVVFAAVAMGTPATMAVAQWAGWVTGVATIVGGFTVVLVVIFPTGRGHTSAWDAFARLTALTAVAVLALLVTQPGPLHLFTTLENPIGIGVDLRPVFGVQASVAVGLGACFVVPLIAWAFVSRYRSASPIERLQLRWFAAATIAWMLALPLVVIPSVFLSGELGELPLTVFALSGMLVPLAIGLAIMRYRLYDIDRVISRTLAYLILSTVLAASFAVATLGLGALFGELAQGETIAVAAATLLVAASFGPVRSRAQALVDRHFDRAAYDAEQTVIDLTEHLRDDVDLAHLAGDVLGAVDLALHPSSRSLWLRSSGTVVYADPTPVTISGHSLPKVTPT